MFVYLSALYFFLRWDPFVYTVFSVYTFSTNIKTCFASAVQFCIGTIQKIIQQPPKWINCLVLLYFRIFLHALAC